MSLRPAPYDSTNIVLLQPDVSNHVAVSPSRGNLPYIWNKTTLPTAKYLLVWETLPG